MSLRLPSVALASTLASLVTPTASAQSGHVLETHKISNTSGGFGGTLLENDGFGVGLTAIGDLDGDGVEDLAVSTFGLHPQGNTQGVLWILFMQPDFRVKSERMILRSGEPCGDVENVGDLDGDGLAELALSMNAFGSAAVDILFLRPDGTERLRQRLLPGDPVFVPPINGTYFDQFGADMTPLGDIDGDGLGDLAIGAPYDDDGDERDNGAIWLVTLASDGRARTAKKLSMRFGGGLGRLDTNELGRSIACLGDLDGDGNLDLAARVRGPWSFPTDRVSSELLILHLDAQEELVSVQHLPQQAFGFTGDGAGRNLDVSFSRGSFTALGDLDGDGTLELACGAPTWRERVDTPAQFTPYQGAVVIASLRPNGTLARTRLISRERGGLEFPFYDLAWFGGAVARVPDLDGDGSPELLVGAQSDNDFANGAGSAWLLDLDSSPERNGSGVNPLTLRQHGDPLPGRLWKTTLDCSAHAPGLAYLAAHAQPLAGRLTPYGEALIDTRSPRIFLHTFAHSGAPVTAWSAIPPDPALIGRFLHLQGLCFGAPGPQLSNALDVILGG